MDPKQRVIGFDSAKLFHIEGEILDLDFLAVVARPEYTEFVFRNPVPILDETFRGIGYADVYLSPTRQVLFTGSIKYETPVRLDIETDNPVYVRPYGVCSYWDENPNVYSLNAVPKLRSMEIGYIRLVKDSVLTQSKVRRLDNATIVQNP